MKYQKYPSVEWDTTDVDIGNHTLFVIVDKDNTVDELDESNNENSLEMRLYKTFENEEIALYYAEVFFYDWKLDQPVKQDSEGSSAEYKNPSLIVAIYGMTFALVARDWRKRKWT